MTSNEAYVHWKAPLFLNKAKYLHVSEIDGILHFCCIFYLSDKANEPVIFPNKVGFPCFLWTISIILVITKYFSILFPISGAGL